MSNSSLRRVSAFLSRHHTGISAVLVAISAISAAWSAISAMKANESSEKANQYSEAALNLQRLISDYSPTLVVNPDFCSLSGPAMVSRSGDLVKTWHYGYMRAGITVITPHYMNFTVRLKRFTVGDSEFLDQNRINETTLSPANEQSVYTDFVEPGLSRVSVNILMVATLFPVSAKFPPGNVTQTFRLGEADYEIILFDTQTKTQTMNKTFTTIITAVMENPFD